MTFLITADLHLNTNPRDQYRHEFVGKTLPTLIRREAVEGLVILGDLTDEADWHPAVLVNQVVEYLYQLSQFCPVILLKGNHDYTSLVDTAAPFFSFVSRLQRVFWVGAPLSTPSTDHPMSDVVKGLGKVLWLPHTPNYQADWANIQLKRKWDWIFAHNTFAGAQDNGWVAGGIQPDIFSNSARVISGDIHTPQSFGPITYCGAPYRIRFGDDYSPRVLLIKDDKLQSIPCVGPQKHLIKLPSSEPPKDAAGTRKGDIVRIQVALEPDEVARWAEIKDHIRNWAEDQGLVVNLIQPLSSPTARMTKRVVTHKSDEELVKSYAKSRQVDERTLKTGLELLK